MARVELLRDSGEKNIFLLCGQDSVAGVATRYGLDGLGIESRWL